jgi:hypothetical protein
MGALARPTRARAAGWADEPGPDMLIDPDMLMMEHPVADPAAIRDDDGQEGT